MATFALCLMASLILGIFTFFLTFLVLGMTIFSLIFICFLASILASLVLIPMTLGFTVWIYKKGYDPDNIMGPFVTSSSDVVSVISLILAIGFLVK